MNNFTKDTNTNVLLNSKHAKTKELLSKIIDKLNITTNARSIMLLTLIFYFLGKSLNYLIYLILFLYLYLITFRFVRFWVKNSLMYMLDFIYFGNILLIIFLLFYNHNEAFFLLVFSCSTGVISLTIITDNNEVELNDSDFITSTFLDCIPILITSTIRWKHLLYREQDSDFVINVGEKVFCYDYTMQMLIFSQIGVWMLWSVLYMVLNGKVLRQFAYSNLYESSICKFYHSKSFKKVLGDHKQMTIVKYLIVQCGLMLMSIPVVISVFYHFYCCVVYILFIIVLIGYNSSRGRRIRMELLINKAEMNM
jgi:hypothetical protein